MKLEKINLGEDERCNILDAWLKAPGGRLGLITSIDGKQLITLGLDTINNSMKLWETPLRSNKYSSLTLKIPQAHWYERTMWDLFGLEPEGHPRLKHNLLHEEYANTIPPLRSEQLTDFSVSGSDHKYRPMPVMGDGVCEIPVGPIHAGIIEPGHFHFSCLGEIIFNLEIRLGYLHRGVEKRLTEVEWQKQRYLAEAAASDSAVANALAHATAIENLFGIVVSDRAQTLRSVSLEIERIAMHINDLSGFAGDVGFIAIAASFGRLRGIALGMAELLTGSRFQRAFIEPGGVSIDPAGNLARIKTMVTDLRNAVRPVSNSFLSNQVVHDRMENIGVVKARLAKDFGLVGVAARASGQDYDVRRHFLHGVFPGVDLPVAVESNGDVLSRAMVRIKELFNSLDLIERLIDSMPQGKYREKLPAKLPANSCAAGIVESHRGELIHLIFTDSSQNCMRYAIKDPSVNNWTALAISARNNLVSDFPLCNKSFSLSYSGHDL